MKNMFPLKIAEGAAFCNRTQEKKTLIAHIDNTTNVVLLAPRRYGKSSLVKKVSDEWVKYGPKRAVETLSMLSVSDSTIVAEKILKVVGNALNKILPLINATDLKELAASIKEAGLEISVSADGFRVAINAQKQDSSANILSIGAALTKLDSFAAKYNWHVLITFDEFQEISRLSEGHAIESEIRDAIQHSTNLSCIFLGSNRQMLTAMFTNKSRPFYNLCQIIHLKRIEAEHYQTHIEEASKAKWNKPIALDSINLILCLTKRHPYYVNKLCYSLWFQDTVPTFADINTAWTLLVEEEEAEISTILTSISPSQKAVVVQLAQQPTESLYKQDFIKAVRSPLPTVQTALRALKKDDIIYEDKSGLWGVMNPCLITHLQES